MENESTNSINAPTNNGQLARGETPADIEKRCLVLCQAYIGGSWQKAQSTSDITVTRITGGITNQLYRVQLCDTVARVPNQLYPNEPTDVAVKLYLKKHLACGEVEDGNERLNDNIILTIMSTTGLGPQVYGIFNDGNVQAFHEVREQRAKVQSHVDHWLKH